MYAGTPVVATAVGGVPEAIDDGKTGFLVPQGAPEEMSNRINYLLSNSEAREKMGEAGLRLAQSRFSKDTWLSDYAELLHWLVNSHDR
jgi:glycosyltransferase involved in cell wall biosynthesis